MSEAFESLRKAGRWGLLLYVKLRNLALQRGMIATDLRGSGDPLINWMRPEEVFSAEARNSLSKVHAHAQYAPSGVQFEARPPAACSMPANCDPTTRA